MGGPLLREMLAPDEPSSVTKSLLIFTLTGRKMRGAIKNKALLNTLRQKAYRETQVNGWDVSRL